MKQTLIKATDTAILISIVMVILITLFSLFLIGEAGYKKLIGDL